MKLKTKNNLIEALKSLWFVRLWNWIIRDRGLCLKCHKNKTDSRSYPYCSRCHLNSLSNQITKNNGNK